MKEFKELIQQGVSFFKTLDRTRVVRVISHADADGISAGSIMVSFLKRNGYIHSLSFVHQLREQELATLANEGTDQFIFCDLAGGNLSLIKDHLGRRKVLILDHHIPHGEPSSNTLHINPCLVDISGSKDISASGVVYLFCKAIDPSVIDLSPIALIGAVGDRQEPFSQLNTAIANDAVGSCSAQLRKGITPLGISSQPLVQLLEWCTYPYLQGITGNKEAAIAFLESIGINPYHEHELRTMSSLSEAELEVLAQHLALKISSQPQSLLAEMYVYGGCDLRSFATIINACGKLNKPALGVQACLRADVSEAMAIYNEYKLQIMNAVGWYKKNRDSMIHGHGYIIIQAKDNIPPTLAGVLSSVVESSEQKIIITLAYASDNTIKVSFRGKGLHLQKIAQQASEKVDGQSGGHIGAAGANFAVEREEEFIEALKQILDQKLMEESIN